MDVGMLYDSPDGKSYIGVKITPENLNTVLFIDLYGDVTIEWGDGTSDDTDTINGLPQHTYSADGDYLIKITGDWASKYEGTDDGSVTYFNYPNFYYWNQIRYIYIASGYYHNASKYSFLDLSNCESLIFGNCVFDNPYIDIRDSGL